MRLTAIENLRLSNRRNWLPGVKKHVKHHFGPYTFIWRGFERAWGWNGADPATASLCSYASSAQYLAERLWADPYIGYLVAYMPRQTDLVATDLPNTKGLGKAIRYGMPAGALRKTPTADLADNITRRLRVFG